VRPILADVRGFAFFLAGLLVTSPVGDVAVADPEFSEQHHNIHYDIMKRHTVEVRFSTSGNRHPDDVVQLLRKVADAGRTLALERSQLTRSANVNQELVCARP
jgi:hypothetical protein